MRAAALLLLLTFAWQTSSAPAPFRRETKPPPVAQLQPGRWALDWCGERWTAELWGGGAYRAWREGSDSVWHGTWRYDPQTRTLEVDEQCSDGCRFRWRATLDAGLCGRIFGGDRVGFARR